MSLSDYDHGQPNSWTLRGHEGTAKPRLDYTADLEAFKQRHHGKRRPVAGKTMLKISSYGRRGANKKRRKNAWLDNNKVILTINRGPELRLLQLASTFLL